MIGIFGIGKFYFVILMVVDVLIVGRVVILERCGLLFEGWRGYLFRFELLKGKFLLVFWFYCIEDVIKVLWLVGKNGVYVVDGGSLSIDVNFDYFCELLVFVSVKFDVLKIVRSIFLF